MKKVIYIIWVALLVVACTKNEKVDEGKGDVRVKFTNNTGFNISNLKVSNRNIGSLSNNQSTGYIRFESFGFDTGMPDESCTGMIKGDSIKSMNQHYWCGTQKSTVEKGTYRMKIILINYNNEKHFQLKME